MHLCIVSSTTLMFFFLHLLWLHPLKSGMRQKKGRPFYWPPWLKVIMGHEIAIGGGGESLSSEHRVAYLDSALGGRGDA